MANLFEPRQYNEEDVKVAMLANGVKDEKIWRAYYVHYAAVGWRDGVGRHITNLQLHIGKSKDSGFLAMIRKNEVPPDPKPKQTNRQSEPTPLSELASDLTKQKCRQELERKGILRPKAV